MARGVYAFNGICELEPSVRLGQVAGHWDWRLIETALRYAVASGRRRRDERQWADGCIERGYDAVAGAWRRDERQRADGCIERGYDAVAGAWRRNGR